MTWASTSKVTFGTNKNFTYGSIYDPTTGILTAENNDYHNTFCAGVSLLPDGRTIAVGGGATITKTSIFDLATNDWALTNELNIPRWYSTTTTLPSGQVLTALGTSSNSYSEIWTEGSGWDVRTNLSLQNVLKDNSAPKSQRSWYPALNVAPDGSLFHSGPTSELFSLYLGEDEGLVSHGKRENGDPFRLYNTTVMYDVGKMLIAGGGKPSLVSAMTVDLNGAAPAVAVTNPMNHARSMHNSVVLPDGNVMVIGGNSTGIQFSDGGSQLTPELWNPDTGVWTELAQHIVPRNYHSTALLLKDARVVALGGGLCGGCATNHKNGQFFEPPYLFNADGTPATRPVITSGEAIASVGDVITLQGSADIVKFNMVRLVALTHHHSTDQRLVPMAIQSADAGSYQLAIASNPNVVIPGYYWIYGFNSAGVPTVGHTIKVSTSDGADTATASATGVVDYEYYEGSWFGLPDFNFLTPKSVGKIDGFNLSPAQRGDEFAIRFTSKINVPEDGLYTFYTSSDDGSELFINGQLVVDNNGIHAVTEQQGTITLNAGLHDIEVGYLEYGGGQSLSVSWKGPGFDKKPINPDLTVGLTEIENAEITATPETGVAYQYFEGAWKTLPDFNTLNPVSTGNIDSFSIEPALRDDQFAFRYNARIQVGQDGQYTFYTASNDGSQLSINRQMIVNNDGLHPVRERSGTINLDAGTHDIEVTVFENVGTQSLQVSWSGPGFTKQDISSAIVQDETSATDTDTDNTTTTDTTTTAQPTIEANTDWQTLNTSNGSAVQARHEAGGVALNGKFYVMGGRGTRSVSVYDPNPGTWTTKAAPPIELNHFQPVAWNNKIWVLGAFTGTFPNETSVPAVYTYDPAIDNWAIVGTIPVNRRRGSAGAVLHNGLIYLIGGNSNGHKAGAKAWFDAYNPATNEWTVLEDAPSARDHITVAVSDNKLVVAAGRQSAHPNTFGNMLSSTDVFDFVSNNWSTGVKIPTVRAGTMTVNVGAEVIVIGGETQGVAAGRDTVEAYNTVSNSWRTLQPLNQGRHGGAAAVLGNRIHVAAGSEKLGGGPESTSHETLSYTSLAPLAPTDTSIPLANITYPVNSSSIDAAIIDIAGTASDPESGVDSVLVRIQRLGTSPALFWNGTNWGATSIFHEATLDDNGTIWRLADVDLSIASSYRIRVQAFDKQGNRSRPIDNPKSDFEVTEPDTSIPVADITFPNHASTITADIVNISGTASDIGSGVDRVLVRIQQLGQSPALFWDGTNWASTSIFHEATLNDDGTIWSLPNVDLTIPSFYRIRVQAFDKQGNRSRPIDNPKSDVEVAEPDTSIPVAEITFPQHASTIAADVLDIAGSASDTGSGVDRVRVRIQRLGTSPSLFWNGTTWTPTSTYNDAILSNDGSTWTLPNVDLTTSSTYRIRVQAFDKEGNRSRAIDNPKSDIEVIDTDTTIPVADITYPQDTSTIRAAVIDISGTSLDTESGVDRVRVRIQRLGTSPPLYWNGTTWAPTSVYNDATLGIDGSSWTLPNVNLTTPSTYRIRVQAIDNQGNLSRAVDNPKSDFSTTGN